MEVEAYASPEMCLAEMGVESEVSMVLDKKERPSQEVAKAEETKAGRVLANHVLSYRYTNDSYGSAGGNCRIEIAISTDLPFSKIVQEFAKASSAVIADLNTK